MMEKDVCYNKIMLINYEGEKDFTRRIGNIFSSILGVLKNDKYKD